MRLPTLSTIILTLAAQALASLHADFANGGLQDQLPMFKDDEPITRTSTTTRTHYEINVISTVYRTRAHAAHSEPTPNVHPETSESTLVFGVEGTGCDKKACTICRMLNNCSDDEVNCTGCDEAYYCNQCAMKNKPEYKEFEGLRVKKTCSDWTGKSKPCDDVEIAAGMRHEGHHDCDE